MQKTIDKPIPPADGDCCGNGCTPCVWDLYYEQLALWQQQEAQQHQPAPAAGPAPEQR